ncbi:hypothetical protein FDP41_012162 [Naegleria fowleri]|uniref:Uncharacterized protein n=1 Tax=Naegleria fowleri TaxID=5763 RepID=A0A6A5C7S1_NAEFO|nr:uncharacterized protein FDP41_012162 [Naegleria fowleri]KAF0981505.1 hypothetical protein FDP41_012162 [Naegleria fowleri]
MKSTLRREQSHPPHGLAPQPCMARCEKEMIPMASSPPKLLSGQGPALFRKQIDSQGLSIMSSSLPPHSSSQQSKLAQKKKNKFFSLNVGHEKSSFYLKTELSEELKLYQSMEVSQKPTIVIQEMILKEKARKELNTLNQQDLSTSVSSSLLKKTRNQLEFDLLMRGTSEGAQRISQEENAGGNSIFSEALSFEVVKRMFSAELLKTEMEIEYYPGSKKTDYLVRIGQKKYGVSVTRAFNFNNFTGGNGVLTDKMLQLLLYKKLSGIIASSGNVYDEDVWEKQFLHCWVPSMDVAKRLKRQYAKMKCSVKSNTILLITVAGEARSIFMENSADHE